MVCTLYFSFVCILVLKVCIFIQIWFWVASDSSMRNNMTITFVSALTVDFADFLKKPIVLADGHAHTALDFKCQFFENCFVYFCDRWVFLPQNKTMASTASHYNLSYPHLDMRETTQRTDNDFGIPTRWSQRCSLTNCQRQKTGLTAMRKTGEKFTK